MFSFSDRSTHLATNQLSCDFESATGFLRKVRHGEIEILRAIYGAVRDQNWNTVEPKLAIRRFETRENQFYLHFDVDCRAPGVAFLWSGLVEAEGPRLTFQFIGAAKCAFRKNRIGLCVLHPIQGCAGSSCLIQGVGDEWVNGSFPKMIAPHQPFKNLAGLRWWPAPGIEAELRFSGEIFETEDQRNWTDASFKTYCTPLEQPYPVLIEEGTVVEQAVTLEIRSERRFFSVHQEIPEINLESDFDTPMPPLGLSVASHGQALSELELARLRRLRLNHLRVDLHLAHPNWRTNYERAAEEASAINAGLQVALFLTDDGHRELREFRDKIDLGIIRSCLVFHEREISTSRNWLEAAEGLLEGSLIAGGTNVYFAELNRNQPLHGYPAAYSINPQVHAFDDRTLMENLEAQSATIESALRMCPEGLFLSPITLRPRFNPNATAELIEPEGELPSAVDPRQRTLVGACWTAGSLAAVSRCHGVTALTYFETTGWRGLMETSWGSPLPDRFASSPNEIFPVFYVFEFLAGATSVLALSAAPDGLAILGLRDGSGSRRYIVTNLETIPQRVRCRFSGSGLEVNFLSEASVDQGTGTPFKRAIYQAVGASVEFDLPAMSLAFICPNAE
jgi:hypothetical protein